MPTNALRGFLDMIATLVTAHRPTHLVACWDDDWRPQFRVDLIPTYKTHRLVEGSDVVEESPDDLTPQVPIIREALGAVGIARLGAPGFEADDVIGTLTERHRGVMPVDIVTGDRDLLQLVDDANGIRVLYTGKGGVREPDIATQSFLLERYAVPTGDAYVDMSILRGDTSDGLPGVKGIGDKTAAQLIATYGSLRGCGRPSRRRPRDQGRPAGQPGGCRRVSRRRPHRRQGRSRRARGRRRPGAAPRRGGPRTPRAAATEYAVTNPVNRLLTALALA